MKIGLVSFALICSVMAAPSDVTIANAWAKAPKGENTAVYVTLSTNTKENDKLIKAECTFAKNVELHNHIDDNGVMRMRPVESIDVGQKPVEMKPGGLHIMFMGVKPELKDQKEVTVKLTFEKAGVIDVVCPVKAG